MVMKYSAFACVDETIKYTTAARMSTPPMMNFVRPIETASEFLLKQYASCQFSFYMSRLNLAEKCPDECHRNASPLSPLPEGSGAIGIRRQSSVISLVRMANLTSSVRECRLSFFMMR